MTSTDRGRPRRLNSRATFEKLLLRLVAQLALPEPGRPVGERRGVPGGVGVVLHDLGVGVPGGDEVVDLPAAVGHPARPVVAELDPAQRRVVPQESVALAGDDEGHHGLDVPLVEVDHAALQVEAAGRVLAHAVEALAVARGQVQLGVEQPVARRPESARAGIVGPDAVIVLAQDGDLFALAVPEELQVALLRVDVAEADRDLAVSERGLRRRDLDVPSVSSGISSARSEVCPPPAGMMRTRSPSRPQGAITMLSRSV